jgi:hypothetical protein
MLLQERVKARNPGGYDDNSKIKSQNSKPQLKSKRAILLYPPLQGGRKKGINELSMTNNKNIISLAIKGGSPCGRAEKDSKFERRSRHKRPGVIDHSAGGHHHLAGL